MNRPLSQIYLASCRIILHLNIWTFPYLFYGSKLEHLFDSGAPKPQASDPQADYRPTQTTTFNAGSRLLRPDTKISPRPRPRKRLKVLAKGLAPIIVRGRYGDPNALNPRRGCSTLSANNIFPVFAPSAPICPF